MITVSDILQTLCTWAPPETAMEFDNVGLLCGRSGNEVNRVLVALDITKDVVFEAIEGQFDLIVSHHPLIWKGSLNAVTDDSNTGDLILTLAKYGISAICIHTNLDIAENGVNDCLARTLGLQAIEILPNSDNCARTGVLNAPMAEEDFVRLVKESLGCDGVRYMPSGRSIYKVAVGGGSCGDYTEAAVEAECDAFVTSDIKYAKMLYAREADITLVDAGHFCTEDVVCPAIVSTLADAYPAITVMKSKRHGEFIRFFK